MIFINYRSKLISEIFLYIVGVEGQQRPSYEDYHNAKLSILHSVFQVGGYLEEFLNLEMVNIIKKMLTLIIGKIFF